MCTVHGQPWKEKHYYNLLTVYCSLIWPMKQRKHKTVRASQRLIFTFSGFFFLSTTVAEMSSMHFNAPSSSSSMNCTYPPTNNQQNRGNTVIANPLRETNEPDPLCSSFARAHLLSAWDVVAATVGLCIHR